MTFKQLSGEIGSLKQTILNGYKTKDEWILDVRKCWIAEYWIVLNSCDQLWIKYKYEHE